MWHLTIHYLGIMMPQQVKIAQRFLFVIKVVLTGQMRPKRTNFKASYQPCSNLKLPYSMVPYGKFYRRIRI